MKLLLKRFEDVRLLAHLLRRLGGSFLVLLNGTLQCAAHWWSVQDTETLKGLQTPVQD